jgi:glyoxylase-like metal-dependent hydrolase (beta-lactamase superfamily II)
MSQKPTIEAFFDPATFTVSYVVSDPATKRAAIIDSVMDYDAASGRTETHSADRLIDYVRAAGLTAEWILETHVHADHLSAAPYLKDQLGGKIAIGDHVAAVQEVFGDIFEAGPEFATDGSQFDHLFADGETFKIGSLDATAIWTPGHTPACMVYHIGDAAFVGDTLFMPDFGTARCDFPGGDARTLYHSIQKLFALPDETRLFMCHDYKAPGRTEFAWETTIGAQRLRNIHIAAGTSEDEFVQMRSERDATLSMPGLILPSVQVNMRAGNLPEPTASGRRYLKIPLNAV